jgi:hypothetical protein
MPFIPVFSISRSQSVRLGRGPGSAKVHEIYGGDRPVNPETGGLNVLFYANLNDPLVRRDYQHHSALGALSSGGNVSLTETSDLFADAGSFQVSAGTGLSINVSDGNLFGRTFGGNITVPAVTNVPLASAPATGVRVDTVAIDNTGKVFVVQGVPAAASQVYEVDSVATTGAPTGGTVTLTYTYNGSTFTTAPIAYDATAAQVAAAVQAAGALPGTLTGTGGPLGTAAVTLTASGGLTGTFSNLSATSSLTGGTTPTVTYTQTTAGVQGPVAPVVSGNSQTVATVTVAAGDTAPGAISNSLYPTS